MKSPPTMPTVPGDSSPVVGAKPPLRKEGSLVSQMASRFQQQRAEEEKLHIGNNGKRNMVITKPCRLLFPPAPTTSSVANSSLAPVNDNDDANRKPVARTESHHTRFNNARAMFEKMGSAEELVRSLLHTRVY